MGLLLVAIAVSGAAIVFRTELRDSALSVEWDGKTDIGWQTARDMARAAHPEDTLVTLWFPNELRPYYQAGFYDREGEFHWDTLFHPATGELVPPPPETWVDWLEIFHQNLQLGSVGQWLVEWSTVLFVGVLISGLYLWWPGWRLHLWFPIRRRGQLFVRDLHRVLGFLSAPVLLIMTVTGVFIAFPTAANYIIHVLLLDWPDTDSAGEVRMLESVVPAGPVNAVTDEQLLAKAVEWAPEEAFVFYITYPSTATDTIQVRLQKGFEPAPFGEVYRVYFDQYSGEILGSTRPDGSAAERVLNYWNSILHFGTFGGLPSKILWTVIPLLVPFFAVTGIILWRRRTRSRRGRKRASSKAATVPDREEPLSPRT